MVVTIDLGDELRSEDYVRAIVNALDNVHSECSIKVEWEGGDIYISRRNRNHEQEHGKEIASF